MLSELREREFGRLDAQNLAYLDYTGSALYGESQVRVHYAILRNEVFGNPHSEHDPSRVSSAWIATARQAVLRFFDVDSSTHEVCFTANTSAAIKLVAESYPFGPQSAFLLSADNHNSVNGIREYARRAGARIRYLPLDSELRLRDPESVIEEEGARGGGLFAFPAQSNFSGVLHPLTLVKHAQAHGFDVLIDVAAYAPSHRLSLRECPADFAALSFYKLFGYPTGIGALVARRDALARLQRPWFAGGTVLYVSALVDTSRLRPGHDGFEDGTPDFIGLAALPAGFALLNEVGMPRLTAHVERPTSNFLEAIGSIRHDNGKPVARVYGPSGMKERGGTVAFNLTSPGGQPIPFPKVESRARAAGVSFRGGCFCNPGASEAAFALDAGRMSHCFDTVGQNFSVERFGSCVGTPVGAVRASFGLANNDDDVRRGVEVVASFRR